MQLVAPPLLVVGGVVGKLRAEIDVVDVSELRLPRQLHDHCVEGVDELHRNRDAFREIVVPPFAEPGFQPRPGNGPQPAEETAAVRNRIAIAVHQHGHGPPQVVDAQLRDGAQDCRVSEADPLLQNAFEDLRVETGGLATACD